MRRVAVVGPSAAGKSTLARRIAGRMGSPWLELDALFHQPGWTELPVDEFRVRVREFVAGESWAVDGNYARVQDLVLARADTVIWLRPRRVTLLANVLRRTSARLLLRRELWNGNRESLRNVLSRDPERSIVRWAWLMHDKYDEGYRILQASAPAGQEWHVLTSRRSVERVLASM